MKFLLIPVLYPFSVLYCLLMGLRNLFYDLGLFKSYKINCKIVCVGNLTMGGTGKTPVVKFLMEESLKRHRSVAILSRGYGGKNLGPQRVDGQHPKIHGDEPSMLAQAQPSIPVYVAIDRVAGCKKIMQDLKPDLIILDDGFQHRRIRRNMDLVILDALDSPRDLFCFPLGRGREPFSSIKRADAVIISKSNLTTSQSIQILKSRIPKGKVVLEVPYQLEKMKSIGYSANKNFDATGKRYLLVSAVGNPSGFEKLMRNEKVDITSHLVFKDHHDFSEQDATAIFEKMREQNADGIIVTEKDAVKLSKFNLPDTWVCLLKLDTQSLQWSELLDRLFS